MQKARKFMLIAALSLTGLCLLLIAFSAISNQGLPQKSTVIETLSEEDKIRLAETLHLRQMLGNAVWPGWGQADIPAIIYNESYAFLVGYPQPPAGWVKVPSGLARGAEWEIVPGDTFTDQTYYRQRLTDPNITPQAFTVLVGQRWVSSLQTLDWAKISLVQPIRQDLPPILRSIFPYRLFIGQLLGGSDKYITLIAHEAFHAYQGIMAPDKLAAAENTNIQYESQYPWNDLTLQGDWQVELDLLAQALLADDQTEVTDLARKFIKVRTERRESAGLSLELVRYEQQREWLEGLARYAELEIWRLAANSQYLPVPDTADLPDFDNYAGFNTTWSNEISQISRMAKDEGDGRFWKQKAFSEGVWIESFLIEALDIQQ